MSSASMWLLPLICLTYSTVYQTSVSATPLDDYVNKPDPHYSFKYLSSITKATFTVHILNMTSQKWLNERASNRALWWHYLSIIVPHRLNRTDTALLWISSGSNSDKPPTLENISIDGMVLMAVSTGTVTATVGQIPNQPIIFKNDPSHRHRREDDAVAWSFHEFMARNDSKQTNADVVLHLPMTKACVRAMDTIANYTNKATGHTIRKFFLAGASKRGWATWLTAAVDKRVIGIAPVVLDELNITANFHHHFRSYGGWSFALKEYFKLNVTRMLDTSAFRRIVSFIDPLVYNKRYIMPKLIITATGDEFFLPDDSHYYYKSLHGPKYLSMQPNADHIIIGHLTEVLLAIRSFYIHVINAVSLPNIRWERLQTPSGGKITVWFDKVPSVVQVHYAHTLKDGRRDFRLLALDPKTKKRILHPVLWFKAKAKRINDYKYEAHMDKPDSGWAAFFIQVMFPGINDDVLDFTTETCIVPDTFPFPDCSGPSCMGSLV